MTKRKTKVTASKDAPAQKERGALDLVRLMVIQNFTITADEVSAQLPKGKVISDSSLAGVLYEVRKNLTLLTELGLLKKD